MKRLMTAKTKAIGGLVLAVASLVATPHAGANEKIYQQTIRSVVLIVTPRGSLGTGFVVDAARRIVVTANHVPGQDDQVTCYFPQQASDGAVINDRGYYFDIVKKNGKTSLVDKHQLGINGRVVGRNPKADVALIQLDRLPPGAEALALGRARVGSEVHIIGNASWSYGGLFDCRQGMVTNRYSAAHIGGFGPNCTVLETQVPQNHGDSGGPVINDRGEVVGIVHGGMEPTKENEYPSLVEFAIDSCEIQVLLDQTLPKLPPS